ncbi:MAG: helix-hairpin-helix domain-containing protein [Bacteroidales bacterium]
MEKWKKPFKEWFGYNRRERVATMVLLVLVCSMLLVRYLLPERRTGIEVSVIAPIQTEADSTVIPVKEMDSNVRSASVVRVRQMPVINLNMCDSSDLERLPGIGPVLSSRIVRYGNLLGGYADVRQLHDVYGLQASVIERISGMVMADTLRLRKLSVNSDSYAVLLRHPYLRPEHVTAIVRYRERQGIISDWSVMKENGMVPLEKEEFMRYYIIY